MYPFTSTLSKRTSRATSIGLNDMQPGTSTPPVPENCTENNTESVTPDNNKTAISALVSKAQLHLENKGSVARDHLANERTFLSWIRTAFTIMSLGVAFIQMYSILNRAKEAVVNGKVYPIDRSNGWIDNSNLATSVGIITGILLLVVILFGTLRYFSVQHKLQKNVFPATRAMILLVVLLALSILVLIMVVDIKTIESEDFNS